MSDPRVWSRRAPAVLAALLTLLAAGATARGAETPAAPPPPGRLVDVGGYSLHLYCTGEGRPTVVTAAGLGDYSIDWGLVQPRVARFTRICSYDRAGYAWSDADPQPRSLQRAADELHALLRSAQVPGPYVVVGHSWGGHIARTFAAQHAEQVGGVVLVDASHEDSLDVINGQVVRPRLLSREELQALFDAEMAAARATGAPAPPAPAAATAAPVPPPKAPPKKAGPPYDRLPDDLQRLHLWARSKGLVEDISDFQEPLRLVHSTRAGGGAPLGDRPLIVLTRGRAERLPYPQTIAAEIEEDRRRLQADLATLSTRGRQVVAERSGHHIQLEEPRLVVRAIREVVEKARAWAAPPGAP